jgi:peptidoglycan hydrolase-like protein with peptidoglycan-binding domain
METLAYLHLALAYEAPTGATDVYISDSLQLFEWLKRQKLAKYARIYLLSLVVILGILGMAGEALAQRALRLGDRGPDVTFIQERLRQLRYLNQSADGLFGSATRDALIQFQRDNRLIPDGIAGTETQSALFAEFDRRREISRRDFNFRATPDRVLQRGDRGADVTDLQRRLRELGYFNGQLTGYFGSTTQEAVSRFQIDNDIEADGVVGSRTRSALFGSAIARFSSDDSQRLPPPPPPSGDFSGERFDQIPPIDVLRLGDRGSEVRDLQQELRQRGFNPGRVDGVYGRQTESAVRQFQSARGLSPDGIAGRETLTALGIIAERQRNRYIVVVPIRGENTLDDVSAVVGFGNASVENSKLGRYVNAGSFPNRASAESRSYQLRSRGLDARVAYR